jgi:hypothetical protein
MLSRLIAFSLRNPSLVLVAAGLPSFVAEAKFSGDAFRLFRWRSRCGRAGVPS